MPAGIDAKHLRADLREGVLTIVIPKRPELQARKIAIKGPASKA